MKSVAVTGYTGYIGSQLYRYLIQNGIPTVGIDRVTSVSEIATLLKTNQVDTAWINGGLFVCQPEVFDTIAGDETLFEREPLESFARNDEMMEFKHYGFWKPMDTLKDKTELESMLADNEAEWKVW